MIHEYAVEINDRNKLKFKLPTSMCCVKRTTVIYKRYVLLFKLDGNCDDVQVYCVDAQIFTKLNIERSATARGTSTYKAFGNFWVHKTTCS